MREAQECCTNAERHNEVCNGARCREFYNNAEVREREHLSAAVGASASMGVSSPIGRLVGRSVTYFSVTELQCSSGQHDAA